MRQSISLLIAFMLQAILATGQSNPWYEQGQKSGGRKVGVWTYYDSPDNIGLIYDHTQEKVQYVRADTTRSLVHLGDWVNQKTEFNARIKGSYEPFYAYIQGTITAYTRDIIAKRNYLYEYVYIGFSIDEAGKLNDVSVLRSEKQDLNQKIVAAFLGAPFEWLPSIKDGKAVASILAIPIIFCADCEQLTPKYMVGEAIPITCPILPRLMIQRNALKVGYAENRSSVITKDVLKKRYSRNRLTSGLHGDVDEYPQWSDFSDQIVFFYKRNLFEYRLEKGTTRQLTKSHYLKSNLNVSNQGWVFNQENSFGVDEVFHASPEFSEIKNLSREIKWPEIGPIYPDDSPVFVTGEKGNGEHLISIDPTTGDKKAVFANQPVAGPYILRDGYIAHCETKKPFLQALCISAPSGQHTLQTPFFKGLNLEAWAADGKYLIYSLRIDGDRQFHSFDLQSCESYMLPVMNGEVVYWMEDELLMAKSTGDMYVDKTQLYFYNFRTRKLRDVGQPIKNLQHMFLPVKGSEILLSFDNALYRMDLLKGDEPEFLVKDATMYFLHPNRRTVFYHNQKTGLPYLLDLTTRETKAVLIPNLN